MHATWGTDLARRLILASAIVNAALFAALLPLWEGFDEAFHYGYVEELWQSRKLPVLGRTTMPADVVASFQLAPISNVVRPAMREAIGYDGWFALPDRDREERRRALERLHADPRPTARGNYEAHQPPLAYLLLAPIDWSLAKFPLLIRVLALRLFCGISSALLMFFGARALCRALEAPEPFATAVLFCVLSSEMFYAAAAHVANDWLAVGIAAFFFVALAERRSPLRVAAWLSAGLLTKAYFVVFALFAAAALLWQYRSRVRALAPAAALVAIVAGPWYVRNIALYGSPGGSPESFDGIGIRQTLAAATRIDWPATVGYLARASLWTGNNMFNSYSRATLNFLLALLALGMAMWCSGRRAAKSAEWVTFAAVAVFLAAVFYEGSAMVADRPTQAVAGPSPWYTQALLAPILSLVFLGCARWNRAGRAIAAVIATLWAWILAATWIFKLFPMYASGTPLLRAKDAWHWWTHTHAHVLSLTALAPAAWLYAGLAAALALTVGAWSIIALLLSKQ
jgi:hypothetical protein